MSVGDTLGALVVDETEIARDELAEVLRPYLRFTRSGEFLLEDAFTQLPARERVMCLLMGIRAAQVLGLRGEVSAGPGELAALGGMAGGTVRPVLRSLSRDRLVVRTESGYTLATHAVRRVSDALRVE